MCYFNGNMMVCGLTIILRSLLLRAICMVLGELLCCLAALGGPLGDSWEVLGDPWGLPLVVLRALLGTSWRPLGHFGPPLFDLVSFLVTVH